MGRLQQAEWKNAFQGGGIEKDKDKLKMFMVSGILIIEGPECCAQEFELHFVHSGVTK